MMECKWKRGVIGFRRFAALAGRRNSMATGPLSRKRQDKVDYFRH